MTGTELISEPVAGGGLSLESFIRPLLAQVHRAAALGGEDPLSVVVDAGGMRVVFARDPEIPATITRAGRAGQYSWKEDVEAGTGTWTDPASQRSGACDISTTGNTTNGNAAVTNIPSTVGMVPFQEVSGSGIQAGATILSIDSDTQITLSANATATTSGVALTLTALNAAYERNLSAVDVGTHVLLRRAYTKIPTTTFIHEFVFDHCCRPDRASIPGLDGRDGADSFIPGPPGRDGRDGTPAPVIPGLDGADGERGWLIPPKQESGHRVISETIPAGTYHNYPIPGSCDQWNIIPSGGPVYFTGLLAEPREVQIRNGAAKPAPGAMPYKICFLHQNSGSSAANRFLTPDRQPLNHQPQEVLHLKYEATEERYTFGERPSQPTYPGLGQYGGGSPGPSMPPNPQTGTTYTPTRSDRGGLITRSNSSTMSDTIPIFDSGWHTTYQNLGPGTLTLTPTSGTINGSGSLTVPPGQEATIASDGTNLSAATSGGNIGDASGTATAITPASHTILDISGRFVAGVSCIKLITNTSNSNPLNTRVTFYDKHGKTNVQNGACYTSPSDQRFQGGQVPLTIGATASVYNAPCVRITVELWLDIGTPPLDYEHTWAFR